MHKKTIKMKKIILTLTLTFYALINLNAQSNKIDIGLFGLLNRNLSFSFEHTLSDYATFRMGASYMLTGELPWLDASKGLLDSSGTEGYLEIALNKLRISAYSFTPEFRFYPKGAAMTGLYIAPYLKYADYRFTSVYQSDVDYFDADSLFTAEDVVFDLSGHIRKAGAGLAIGYQWLISDAVSLDFCFFGPGFVYAFASSTVDAPKFPASRDIGEFTQEELSEIPDILGLIDVEQVTPTQAKGTWNKLLPIYRFNISIGFAF
ncbi:MAG: hypothetical protein A2W91_18395 [Bacteroidetes bacterium GWF2_38_335]|nr:MAG: hypothetical protein A2W91_18395 [Bacteroidetes bacterium GWF2_38_335]OFY80064.1 MAG: hypothetical protein A2281_12240 [Bacteroidetes bacterium RIFOXYA12_FULL_38_20]